MLRKQKTYWIMIGLILSLVSYGGWLTLAQAAPLSYVRDTISDSYMNIPADHAIEFTTAEDIGDNGYFEATLPAAFGDIGDGACAGPNATIATTTTTIRCTYSSTPGATSTKILLYNVANPGAEGIQILNIVTYNASNQELERGQAAVYITGGVIVNARVLEDIAFSMAAGDDIMFVNGIALTGSSTATSVPFGPVEPGASSTIAQTLSVETNAEYGFSLTVQQTKELTNDTDDTINSFNNSPDGTGSTTPQVWAGPKSVVGSNHTYGHIGVTTDDATLSVHDFTGSKYIGLDGAAPAEVMYHSGNADGETLGIGLAHVAYTLEISALQEAGNYETTIMYICTPTY